jgi:signal transduction histidine kinase
MSQSRTAPSAKSRSGVRPRAVPGALAPADEAALASRGAEAAAAAGRDAVLVAGVAGVVHELKTPLTSVLGHAAMLLDGVGGELTSAQRRMVERVDSSGRHALALVNDLLDLARMGAGQMVVERATFCAGELLAEVAGELSPMAGPDVRLLVEVPPAAVPLVSDRVRVKQILLNLTSNALKFTPSGLVRLSLECAAAHVSLVVTDSGVGIAEADHSVIFEPFRQLGPSSSRGAGLGLAVCRELAGLLGAALTVQSRVGHGSTFMLRVPVATG